MKQMGTMGKLLYFACVILVVSSRVTRGQYCPGNQWTQYYNRDKPSVTGDWELLDDLRDENPGKICESPTSIDVRLANGLPYALGRDFVTMWKSYGFVCKNELQKDGICSDYKVRFCCPKCEWTRWFNRDHPSGTGDYETLSDLRKENPGNICPFPVAVDGKVRDGKGNDNITMTPSTGLVCKNKDQWHNSCKDYEVRFLCC